MKKILITGGSGTVGTAFIKKYYNDYHFISYSRNEKMQVALKREFEDVEIFLGAVEDSHNLISTFLKVQPDIVIHAAALKHVDTGEKQPIQAIRANIIGSLNIIEASTVADVPITIGISTDKACQPDCVYGYSKYLMERMFIEANSAKNRFACTRFGNVAGSHGSVIPYWLRLIEKNAPLKLTDPEMTRLMFLPDEAATLVKKAIQRCEQTAGGFILSKQMKSVNILELANTLLQQGKIDDTAAMIQIIGKRPGEKLDEFLISEKEIPYTMLDDDYIILEQTVNIEPSTRIAEPLNSQTAQKMNQSELKQLIENVKASLSNTLLSVNQY